ncbi:Chemotaxis protein CheW [Candidatus Filomicrobium marinum]|uniref:Chemotaxis protein CheW n=2 Tax=Filomicrobium TaxID=119044 RepID=A0A0D6JJP6_9HYPH|nr:MULTISPECIES: chemotaxis protein CheW [Filomicrobium]MCV0371371.1 chemotaxis protein CheW [Filomicrobium sp.]CFX55834.1 Chemotaxis protein CheW [Candidatus Filomicrobium marinum]CPR22209.1 Chemotaxis protein CheW [Candidatus Filomicrobium marinum]SDO92654.1 purine-binding chemotaxis protein CheW [Filomicrobium insigne]
MQAQDQALAVLGDGDERIRTSAQSYFTIFIGEEIFGISVQDTQTIFRVQKVTPIPHAPKDIVGLVNIRGKIVTAVSLRRRLRLDDVESFDNALAIGMEHKGENFALMVDQVGDVLSLDGSMRIPTPPHFDPIRASLMSGLYRVNDFLIPVLDVGAVFDFTK